MKKGYATYIYSSIIHNSENMETTQMPIETGMAKEIVGIATPWNTTRSLKRNSTICNKLSQLKTIRLIEISQSQNNRYHMFSLI